MKVEVNMHNTIVIQEVYTPIDLVTNDGEVLTITMRDSGFELWYQNKPISLKKM